MCLKSGSICICSPSGQTCFLKHILYVQCNVLNNEHVLSAQKEPKTQEIEDVALQYLNIMYGTCSEYSKGT